MCAQLFDGILLVSVHCFVTIRFGSFGVARGGRDLIYHVASSTCAGFMAFLCLFAKVR